MEGPLPAAMNLTDLILTGHHAVLRIGIHQDVLKPYFLWYTTEVHPDGGPLGCEVEIDHLRFSIGLDRTGSITYWVLKQSLQDHSFLFTTGNKEIRLGDIDAFGLLGILEEQRVAYTREIWGNAVCVVTVLQSGVSLSFDLAPSIARGPASIQLSDTPLYIGGDVFRKLKYD